MGFDLPTVDKKDIRLRANNASSVKKVIAVMSGKGGVGKSSVCAVLATELRKRGYAVGVLDADITGPSQPKLFGINGLRSFATEDGIMPVETATGIRVVSINLLIDDENEAVIWRSPLINQSIKQFFTETAWGNLDVLLIDMPPGTGDVPLTLMQSFPMDGFIVVSSPQDLVQLIVKKSIAMAKKMNMNLYGIIENMSYFICPDNNKKYNIFGESGLANTLKKYNIDMLDRIPIDPEFTKASDTGTIENYIHEKSLISDETIEKLVK